MSKRENFEFEVIQGWEVGEGLGGIVGEVCNSAHVKLTVLLTIF